MLNMCKIGEKPGILQTCFCAGEPREQHPSHLPSRRRSSGLVDHDQVTSHDPSISNLLGDLEIVSGLFTEEKATENGISAFPQGGSSLDLSPSDSCGSGGIYMWDEEGLDPLGGLTMTPGSNTTHHIGSFDSDLNSVVSCHVTTNSRGPSGSI